MAEKKGKKSIEEKLKDGEIEMVESDDFPEGGIPPEESFSKPTFENYLALIQQMRGLKKTLTSAPTFTPKNFYESIQFYDTGGVRRLYLFVNLSWRYVVLT